MKEIDSHKVNYIPLGELFVYVILLAMAITFLYEAYSFTDTGRLFPIIILYAFVILLIIKISCYFSPRLASIIDVKGELVTPEIEESCDSEESNEISFDREESTKSKTFRELKIFGWIFILLGLVYLVGFLYSAVLFLLIFLLFQAKYSILNSIIYSGGVFLFVYVVFDLILSVRFPAGILIMML